MRDHRGWLLLLLMVRLDHKLCVDFYSDKVVMSIILTSDNVTSDNAIQ